MQKCQRDKATIATSPFLHSRAFSPVSYSFFGSRVSWFHFPLFFCVTKVMSFSLLLSCSSIAFFILFKTLTIHYDHLCFYFRPSMVKTRIKIRQRFPRTSTFLLATSKPYFGLMHFVLFYYYLLFIII